MTVAIATQPYEHLVLRNISWGTYEALLRDLESEPAKRLTYDRGALEIVVPLPPHE